MSIRWVILSFVVLLSKKRDFVREMEKEMFRDMGSNMMIFQNNSVGEMGSGVMGNGVI